MKFNRILNNSKAEACYKNAVKYRYQLQDSIVYLRLAQVQAYLGKYKDAEKNYTLYLQEHGDSYVAQAGLYSVQQMNEWEGRGDVISLVMEIVDNNNTYKVLRKKPDGNSYARNIAAKYGVTYEQMLTRIK